jgi:hypothetical protein
MGLVQRVDERPLDRWSLLGRSLRVTTAFGLLDVIYSECLLQLCLRTCPLSREATAEQSGRSECSIVLRSALGGSGHGELVWLREAIEEGTTTSEEAAIRTRNGTYSICHCL